MQAIPHLDAECGGPLPAIFKALGDPTRLKIFRFLAGCCGQVALDEQGEVRPVVGKSMGEVCCSVCGTDKVTSTLSHHIRELKYAGLIEVERQGRFQICRPNPDAMRQLKKFLKELNAGADCE